MAAPAPASSTPCESGELGSVRGSTEPRIWTPPLRELTPETSYGFEVIRFADRVLAHPLDPWQAWLAVHAGELLPDGRPRFRKVIILVSRQNGKTELLVVLVLFWQFVDGVPLVLGTSTKLDYARESWIKATSLAERTPDLDEMRGPKRWKRETNGEQVSWATDPETKALSRYKIAASNEEGGRSLTIDRLVLDELRQHHSYTAWDASVPATNAVRDAQIYCLSNMGDDESVVLNTERTAALRFIETGEGDYRTGLFEWSAPEDAEPTDLDALAAANPNLGYRIDPEVLLADATTAVATGGEKLIGFKTECMCIRVRKLNPAYDPTAWRACLEVGDLSHVRNRVAVCLDVAPDGEHATLVAAAELPDTRVRGEVVKAWDSTRALRRDLPGLLAKVKPKVLGWFPSGPAAAIAAAMAKRPGRHGWPPAGIKVEEIKSEVTAVCMGLDEQIKTGSVVHAGDPLLDAHVTGAERLKRGDGWVLSRKGDGHCDAAYALAGAVHLARTLPPSPGKPRLVIAD